VRWRAKLLVDFRKLMADPTLQAAS
jgi:aryl carrier-like protein